MVAADYEFTRRVGFALSFSDSQARGWFTVVAVIVAIGGATLGFFFT